MEMAVGQGGGGVGQGGGVGWEGQEGERGSRADSTAGKGQGGAAAVALCSMRRLTTSVFPLWAAMERGVDPVLGRGTHGKHIT